MMLCAVVAVAENGVLGRKGGLPWKLPADLQHFKKTTMGYPLIMGRKTHESIGRALPGRVNVVISRDACFAAEGCLVAGSLGQAMDLAGPVEKCFIIGGGEIYRLVMSLLEEIHLTRVHAVVEGDVFFPELEDASWELLEQQRFGRDEKNEYDFSFCRYRRRRHA